MTIRDEPCRLTKKKKGPAVHGSAVVGRAWSDLCAVKEDGPTVRPPSQVENLVTALRYHDSLTAKQVVKAPELSSWG